MTNNRTESTSASSLSSSSWREDLLPATSVHEATNTTTTTTQTTAPSSSTTTTWRMSSSSQQPNEHDIICGRGKSILSHAGNLKFRQWIVARRDEYQAACQRDDKSRIVAEILQALQAGPFPSRFLIKDNETDLYREVDMVYAREKVSHALRLSLSKKEKKLSRTTVKSQDEESSSSARHTQRLPKTSRQSCRNKEEWSNEEEAHIHSLIRQQQELLQTFLRR